MMLEAISALGNPVGRQASIADFSTADIRLADRSDIGCVYLASAVPAADVRAALSQILALTVPTTPGVASDNGECRALWLSPRAWLIRCLADDEGALVDSLNARFPDKTVHASRFTDHLAWIEVAGPGADDLLKQGGFVSFERNGLPVGHAKRILLAGVPAVIDRPSADGWLLGIERSRAHYLVDWLIVAARGGE